MKVLHGADILCISSIDWDFIWQGHQEIMSTLAAQGHRVLFVENTGVRSAALRDLPRLRLRIRNWWKGTKGFRRVRDRLFVYSPILLPFPYSRLARWINRRLLLGALRRWMHATNFRRPIVWTFLPTPLVRDVIKDLDPALTVYYCIDDLASSSPQAKRIKHSEIKLFQEADLVFVTSEKLRERAAQHSSRVHLFPFGVDFERFERVRQEADQVPQDLRAVPRPVIGYVGGLHQWVDQELLAAVATRLPQVNFVLVGPSQTDVSLLQRCANIHLFKARPHAEVPKYIKGFDAGIISYRLSEYTAHVYPTKLNEYLAMGIPVIATDLPEIRRFNAEHDGIVAIARTAEEFASRVEEALRNHQPGAVEQRVAVARTNSWSARIARMSELIEGRLAERSARSEGWDAALRRLYRTARRRAVGIMVWAAATYVVLFHSPLLWYAAEPLHVAQPPVPADAIVVFAGGVGESGTAGGGYQERVKQAVDLYAKGLAPRVIFSSGYTFVFREAEMMKELAVSLGMPESAIVLETNASNTKDNVAFVSSILAQQHWNSILLVSSPYHMRRALFVWRKLSPATAVIPVPVRASQFYSHDRGASLEQIQGIVHEYASIVYYWWKGWI